MTRGISRRRILKGMATTALAPALLPITSAQFQREAWWLGDGMPQGHPHTEDRHPPSFRVRESREAFAPLATWRLHVLECADRDSMGPSATSPEGGQAQDRRITLGNLMIGRLSKDDLTVSRPR